MRFAVCPSPTASTRLDPSDRKEQSPLSHARWTGDMSKKQTSIFLSTVVLELAVAAL